MAYQAIDRLFGGKIETVVIPAVTYMADRTGGDVRGRGDTEIVQDVSLAQFLARYRFVVFQLPVVGLMILLRRIGMTFQACPCDVRSALELLLQLFELIVIRGRFGRGY